MWPEPGRVVVHPDRIEIRPDSGTPILEFFTCWLVVFGGAVAGLVAAITNLRHDPSWWSVGSVVVLAPLTLLWSLAIWGERRPSRVFAGVLTLLGGWECVRWRERKGTRLLEAEIRVPNSPLHWVWLSIPFGDVEVTANGAQGGGSEISLKVTGSRWYDSVGDHLAHADAELGVEAIRSWFEPSATGSPT